MSLAFSAAVAGEAGASLPAPLWLLVRVNALQLWRRVKGMRHQSRLLLSVMLLFVTGYITVSFLLFRAGLKFLQQFPGLGTLLTERLLFLLFAFLFGLLLLSNLVISHTNLFRNRETQFLVTLPLSPDTIFRWKFLESTLLASWAFLFLVAPLLAAFGTSRQVGWAFYPVTVAGVALFIVLPAVLGAWCSLTLARYLERKSFQLVLLSGLVLMVAGAGIWFGPVAIPSDATDSRVMSVLDQLLQKSRFAQHPFLPSYWLSTTVLHWAEGIRGTAGFFLLILTSYSLFFGMIALGCFGRYFAITSSVVWSRESIFGRWGWFQRRQARKQVAAYPVTWVERLLTLLRLPPASRAILLKDGRVFWRDTTQWGQTLMLFGLLAVYILNLRHFSHQLQNPFWVHLVAYLNLGACSLNLATVTTRFVFPQFSLEGKRLWIIGMSPVGLLRVVRIKFWAASFSSLAATLSLVLLSCTMLQMGWDLILHFAMVTTVMTFTLNALALGLGVLYPNFKEENPSKIVSGFGGTFCLVLSFLYILVSVVLLGVASPWRSFATLSLAKMNLCWAGFLLLSAAIGLLPYRLGLRRLQQVEI